MYTQNIWGSEKKEKGSHIWKKVYVLTTVGSWPFEVTPKMAYGHQGCNSCKKPEINPENRDLLSLLCIPLVPSTVLTAPNIG